MIMATDRVTVAIQGGAGSFSHQAAIRLLGPNLVVRGHGNFEATVRTLLNGEARYLVLPIHNSSLGRIPGTGKLLQSRSLILLRTVCIPISQCLIGLPDASPERPCRVASHPAALAQCRRFFREHRHFTPVPAEDTATSVAAMVVHQDPALLAIAPHQAAYLYGVRILGKAIQDQPDNRTCFALFQCLPRCERTVGA